MLNIVLYRPQIPQNTGNISRTCAVTGSVLHLIGPMGFQIDDKKLKRAGLTYWNILDVRYYEDFEAFWKEHQVHQDRIFLMSSKGTKRYDEVSYQDGDYLLFGREDKGVPEEVHELFKERSMRLPMRDVEEARCLNLATTVGIATYEALRQIDFKNLR